MTDEKKQEKSKKIKLIESSNSDKNKLENKENSKEIDSIKQVENTKDVSKVAPKKEEPKKSHKKDQQIIKKELAVAKSNNLHLSTKQCKYICSFIKNKQIDKAIADLELVINYKKPVPFKGEIPHRKGKIMSGRYPIKASKLIIKTLKSLRGNILVNNLSLEKTIIYIASANLAARPMRSKNTQGKRTNIILKAKEVERKS
jgi:large subunit ribosomal protein L22